MIEFIDIEKAFADRAVFRGISFRVPRQGITAVLGRSGVGKSVLLKLLVGLVPLDKGDILVDGVSIQKNHDWPAFRRRCSLVFQSSALLDALTVYENIALPGKAAGNMKDVRAAVHEALEHVDLPRSILDRAPRELSFGAQKRVSIARSLMLRPEILLLDEPTTGLDPIATHTLHAMITRLRKQLGTTFLIVSHDIHNAFGIADKIVLLDAGRIAAEGSPKELRSAHSPLVQEFLVKGGITA